MNSEFFNRVVALLKQDSITPVEIASCCDLLKISKWRLWKSSISPRCQKQECETWDKKLSGQEYLDLVGLKKLLNFDPSDSYEGTFLQALCELSGIFARQVGKKEQHYTFLETIASYYEKTSESKLIGFMKSSYVTVRDNEEDDAVGLPWSPEPMERAISRSPCSCALTFLGGDGYVPPQYVPPNTCWGVRA